MALLKTTFPDCDDGAYRQAFKALIPFEKEEKKRVAFSFFIFSSSTLLFKTPVIVAFCFSLESRFCVLEGSTSSFPFIFADN